MCVCVGVCQAVSVCFSSRVFVYALQRHTNKLLCQLLLQTLKVFPRKGIFVIGFVFPGISNGCQCVCVFFSTSLVPFGRLAYSFNFTLFEKGILCAFRMQHLPSLCRLVHIGKQLPLGVLFAFTRSAIHSFGRMFREISKHFYRT